MLRSHLSERSRPMPFRKNKPLDAGRRSGTPSAPDRRTDASTYAGQNVDAGRSTEDNPLRYGDPETLQRRIDGCYDRLAHDPCDLGVRISLSWFLLFQSLCAR